jgi:hypothetical protein
MKNSVESIISKMEESLTFYELPEKYKELIREAHYNNEWKFDLKSDGVTFVNFRWFNAYHPVGVWHDKAMQEIDDHIGKRADYKNWWSYYKVKFNYVRDINLTLKKLMELYEVVPVKYVSKLERYAKLTFIKATIAKFIFGR